MTGAFFYLFYHSWVNRARQRIFRLKQPKYLVGALVGAGYVYVYFYKIAFKYMFGGGVVPDPGEMAWREPLQAFLLFFAVLALAWVLTPERGAVAFSEAEVAFLFPAPVSRKKLVHYKLLKSQTSILLMVLGVSLFTGIFRLGSVGLMRAAGWWMILSVLNLHMIGASFARERLFSHGLSGWKRRALILGLVLGLFIWVGIWAHRTIAPPDVANFSGVEDLRYYIQQVADIGPARYILYPFRLMVRPRLQTEWPAFFQALWPALLILLAHYIWVMRSDVAFEEASIDFSRRTAERLANLRANRGQWQFKPKKKKRAPFGLNPVGIPAVGFLWKNLISAGHVFTARLLMVLAITAVASAVVMANEGTWTSAVGFFSLMLLYMSYLVGPQFLRQDFRQDIPMADLLKSYPMTGWQMALGQLLTPATLLTCLQWLLMILCLGTTRRIFGKSIGLEWRLALGSGMAILAPGLNLVLLIIPNAAVLLFPGWFQTGRAAPQGIEAMGQRLIFAFGQIFVLGIALLPAAVAFGLVFLVARILLGQFIAIPLGAAGALMVLAGEAFAGLWWLGRLFEKFDVATEGASQA